AGDDGHPILVEGAFQLLPISERASKSFDLLKYDRVGDPRIDSLFKTERLQALKQRAAGLDLAQDSFRPQRDVHNLRYVQQNRLPDSELFFVRLAPVAALRLRQARV